MFAVPQTTTSQEAVTSSFLDQLQMSTPMSSQLPSPLTTGALIFKTPARTTLPSPQVSSPLPSFTTPRAEGLGQEDYYLRAITEQISSALASNPRFQLPRPLRLRLQAPGRLQLHQLHLLRLWVLPLQLGLFSARTTTTTTPPAFLFDLRGSSLPRCQIPPLRLSIRLVWCLLPKGEIDR
jgi:hypothetical protein